MKKTNHDIRMASMLGIEGKATMGKKMKPRIINKRSLQKYFGDGYMRGYNQALKDVQKLLLNLKGGKSEDGNNKGRSDCL